MAKVSPLNWQVPIVNPGGTPTSEFQRAWADLQSGLGEVVPLETAAQVSKILDKIGATQGSLLHRGSVGWQIITGANGDLLRRGSSGWQVLPSPNDSAKYLAGDLSWKGISTLLDALSSTQGAVLFRGAAGWAALAPGTSGYFLKTNGAGSDPAWGAGGGGGGGVVPSLVQEQSAIISSGVGTVTLPTAPTAGNLLVAVAYRWVTAITAAAGWTLLYAQAASAADTLAIFYKQAGASEPAAQNFSATSTSWTAAVFELANASLPSIVAFAGAGSLTGTVATVNAGVPGNAFGIGLFMAQQRAAPTLTITGATVGSSASGTRSAGGPANCQSFYKTGLTKGAWGPSCTFSTTGNNGGGAVILGSQP